jgi:hypothetical protein
VEDPGRDVPAGVERELVGPRDIDELVVALHEVDEDALELLATGPGIQAEKGEGEFAGVGVDLGREELHFGLALEANVLRVLRPMVYVVGQGPQIVEELREHGPLAVFLPKAITDNGPFIILDKFSQ